MKAEELRHELNKKINQWIKIEQVARRVVKNSWEDSSFADGRTIVGVDTQVMKDLRDTLKEEEKEEPELDYIQQKICPVCDILATWSKPLICFRCPSCRTLFGP